MGALAVHCSAALFCGPHKGPCSNMASLVGSRDESHLFLFIRPASSHFKWTRRPAFFAIPVPPPHRPLSPPRPAPPASHQPLVFLSCWSLEEALPAVSRNSLQQQPETLSCQGCGCSRTGSARWWPTRWRTLGTEGRAVRASPTRCWCTALPTRWSPATGSWGACSWTWAGSPIPTPTRACCSTTTPPPRAPTSSRSPPTSPGSSPCTCSISWCRLEPPSWCGTPLLLPLPLQHHLELRRPPPPRSCLYMWIGTRFQYLSTSCSSGAMLDLHLLR